MTVTVVTHSPSLVRGTTAKFNGNLTDMNGQAAIDCYFQYKVTGAGSWSDTSVNKEELTAVSEFSYEISGLTENESYDVRAVAEWDDGGTQNAYGDTVTFNAFWVREGSQEDFERGILSGAQPITHQVLAVFDEVGSHSWTVPSGVNTVDVLVVAGGGGGHNGAGGAGGLVYKENHSVTPSSSVTVTVGAGGAVGDVGQNSVFDSLTANGGGLGGYYNETGGNGGSGGGGGHGDGRDGGTATQPGTNATADIDAGHNGAWGGGGTGDTGRGGGGGGAGEAAEDITGLNKGGDGGDGLDFSAKFGTAVGDDGWFAGGGGGFHRGSGVVGSGGKGGGGDGYQYTGDTTRHPGMDNTGGGGGAGAAGGSGIVIIAVPLDDTSLGGEGTRQKPYKITNTESEITWTATTPTDTSVAIEAQVKGTTAITDEAVGTGDGTTKVFYLEYWPADTPAVKVDGVAETGFTLGNDRRTITFDTAPADTEPITASYTAVDDSVDDAVEIQGLDLDSPAGGTFKLGDGTTWTADIAYDATAATIQTALEGLYGAGNVEVEKEIVFDEVGTTSWTVPAGISEVDVLVVAGGGGGGGRSGGGAGGLIFRPKLTVTPSETISVVVGSGTNGVTGDSSASDADDSSFGELVALGGAGGVSNGNHGKNGGSGSGGDGSGSSIYSGGTGLQPTETGESGTPYGFGNDGGQNFQSGNRPAGGGGGAGEPGGDAQDADTPGDGGDGLCEVTINSTTYNFAEIFGTEYGNIIEGDAWFAGGGGGSSTSSANGGNGGKGGGGDEAQNALLNTGGGGGGDGGNGGSGIVIVALPKYLITFAHSVGDSGLVADFTGLT